MKASIDSSGGVHYDSDTTVRRRRWLRAPVVRPGWSVATQVNTANQASLEQLEDLEDLAAGLATLQAYEKHGVSGFVQYSDYTEQRHRRR